MSTAWSMILVPSRLLQLNGNNFNGKKILFIFYFFTVIGFLTIEAQQNPESFLSHKVKKRETIYGITRSYNITEKQLKEYNPLLQKVGLRRRMLLRIPVYKKPIKESTIPKLVDEHDGSHLYIVKPKDSKWRIAYNYKITIPELEALNPQIKKGLKLGQEIRVPILPTINVSKTWDSNFNYYTVKPKEGYYRIEKKIGVTKAILDSLNPEILELGLQEGMVLRVPIESKGEFKIEDDLLVEKISLLDSIKESKSFELAILLPFKANEIEFDSIEKLKNFYKKETYIQSQRNFTLGYCSLLIL